jgi:hypothetical protein
MITTSDLVCISYIPNETECCCIFDRTITDIVPVTRSALPLHYCKSGKKKRLVRSNEVCPHLNTSPDKRTSSSALARTGSGSGGTVSLLYVPMYHRSDLWHRTNTQSVWPLNPSEPVPTRDGDLEPERTFSFDVVSEFPRLAHPSCTVLYNTVQHVWLGTGPAPVRLTCC